MTQGFGNTEVINTWTALRPSPRQPCVIPKRRSRATVRLLLLSDDSFLSGGWQVSQKKFPGKETFGKMVYGDSTDTEIDFKVLAFISY